MFPTKIDPSEEVNYPDPPLFYKGYTKEAVRRGSCLPPPPVPQRFRIFGRDYDLNSPVVQTLESSGVRRLFGETQNILDIKREMSKINQSIIAAFLDLTSILAENPQSEERIEKFNHLRVLFLNFHHLINELRPIQARATLLANQNYAVSKKQKFLSDVEEVMGAAQAALMTAKHMSAEKLPKVHIPIMPILDEDEAISTTIDYVLIIKAEEEEIPAFSKDAEIYQKRIDDERYILTNWKDPPKTNKRSTERYLYRDKVVALKDGDKDPVDSSESDDDFNANEEVAGEKEKEDNGEAMEVEQEAEDEVEALTSFSPPPPDVQKLMQRRKQIVSPVFESMTKEIRRDLPENVQEYLEEIPKYFDKESFARYYKTRGVAPDEDLELLKAIRRKRERMEENKQRIIDLGSDNGEEYASTEEYLEEASPPRKKNKEAEVLEIIDENEEEAVAAISALDNEDFDDNEEIGEEQTEVVADAIAPAGGSEVAEIVAEKESIKAPETIDINGSDNEEENSFSSESDSSIDTSEFSFKDFSHVYDSSDLSSVSTEDEADLLEATIESTIGIPSAKKIRKFLKLKSKGNCSLSAINLVADSDDDERAIKRANSRKQSKTVNSGGIEAGPSSGSTAAALLNQRKPYNSLEGEYEEDENMEAYGEEVGERQRPESLQELNRPSPFESGSPFDDDQPPILEPQK